MTAAGAATAASACGGPPPGPSAGGARGRTARRGILAGMKLALVCVGAGRGERFGGDKLAADLAGRSVLERSLDALVGAFVDAPLVVVVPADRLVAWRARLSPGFPGARCVAGGPRRQDSVRAGVEAVSGAELVAVHDAARPLVSRDDLRRVVSAVGTADGALLVGRIPDTVKRVDGHGRVIATLDRDGLRVAQTPQVLRVAALARAWRAADPGREWTDEAALLEAHGGEVLAVEARGPNPKITTPQDLALAAALLGVPR